MTSTAERIRILIPPTGMESLLGDSLLYRAVTHRGLVRLHNEDAFCVLSKENYHLFAVTDGLGGAIAAAVSLVK